jgi:threonine synthase
MSFVSHVECTICGARHDAKRPLTVCEKCGQMLAVRYDLERVKASVTKDALRRREPGMYRFRELTPVDDGEALVTLGEGGTPLLELRGSRRTWVSGGSGRRTRARIRRARSRRAASAWRSRGRARSAPAAS